MSEMVTPFIILHGSADKVTDPETSKKLYTVAQAKDKDLKPLGEVDVDATTCLKNVKECVGHCIVSLIWPSAMHLL